MRDVWTRVSAPIAVCLATLALVAQLLAPTSHRMAGPAGAAAELKAAFGDFAVLCVQDDGAGDSHAPADRPGPCNDCCPLCPFSSAAHALLPPAPFGAPIRIAAAAEKLAFSPEIVRLEPERNAFAQPRAPPFEA